MLEHLEKQIWGKMSKAPLLLSACGQITKLTQDRLTGEKETHFILEHKHGT